MGTEGVTQVVRPVDSSKNKSSYNPNLGYIGSTKVEVANYLFTRTKKRPEPYKHTKTITNKIFSKSTSEHYKEANRLTRFLKTRDLTFSKMVRKGVYKTFTVPCTTTIVPLPKSLFDSVEKAAQCLIVSLRKVLQDIYGSKNIESSEFINSLPEDIRKIFIDAVYSSSNYFRALHHPNMMDYPFFDNVGLDLVLVEDYLNQYHDLPEMIRTGNEQSLPDLPFKILELNAGSPSGASNNLNMLQGLYNQSPETITALGKVMENDHFDTLASTYKSLGESWTGIKDGVQVLLPPGGQNGAAPEIHQLAAYSGLVYADPVQLYQDDEGYIRLRTVGQDNPIVTAVYSRINADSALFDPESDIILKDPETAEPIYLRDNLRLGKDGKAPLVLDQYGDPIPLQSDYAIPGAVKAIKERKLYLGGLNRILDNKIILSTLTSFAPKFFEKELKEMGLDLNDALIKPPRTLEPTIESVSEIKADPDNWVVKSPNLAGGAGIFILKTLGKKQKAEVLEMISESPNEFAYQELVKIGRIPVAVNRKEGHRFANLAADIRVWVFYGANGTLPKMTHNALVRYAPHEKGAMSSIVNTSKGGGYAPFVVVDDTNRTDSIEAKDIIKDPELAPFQSTLPHFVGAQIVQISRIVKASKKRLENEPVFAYDLYGSLLSLKAQCREVLAFINPRSIEYVYKAIDLVETKISKKGIALYHDKLSKNEIEVVYLLKKYEKKHLPIKFRSMLDGLNILNKKYRLKVYTDKNRKNDLLILKELKKSIDSKKVLNKEIKKNLNKIVEILKDSINLKFPENELKTRTKNLIIKYINNFEEIVKNRLLNSGKAKEFAKLFEINFQNKELSFNTLYLGEKRDQDPLVATQKEFISGKLLTETDYIDEPLRKARAAWLEVLKESKKIAKIDREEFLNKQRAAHFKKFRFLKRYQQLIDSESSDKESLIEILPILPYAKYNLEHFAEQQGIRLEDVFSSRLKANRIALLSSRKLKNLNLSSREHAGECFAKKRKLHGLFSDSDTFIWIRKELDPFTLIYTAGHELIHYQQISEHMKKEQTALKTGPVEFANFLNYYGNFLGVSSASLEGYMLDVKVHRQPLYGLADKIVPNFFSSVITELREALNSNDSEAWDKKLNEYGSLFGYMMPNSPQVKVKALQEVLPALENAKNIIFAQELGLKIDLDPIKSVLPTANDRQIKTYSKDILKAVQSAKIHWETLRIIANHQYYGVYFPRADKEENNLSLLPILSTISLGNSYNQTQQ